jgi:hypothetical protein
MDYFQDKADKAHELKMFELEVQAAEKQHQQRLVEINTEADIREIEAIHRHDAPTGVTFIDGIRGSVRPIITYLFMLLFMAVEGAALYGLIWIDGMQVYEAVRVVWSAEIHAGWMTILGFWFGSRTFMRTAGQK